MAKKERPLTEKQIECLRAAEDTLFGDVKVVPGFGRSVPGLRKRGLVEGDMPHVYLTDAGRAVIASEGAVRAVRMGDFYEIVGEPAVEAAKILDVAVTRRGDSPIVGFPVHAADASLAKLAAAGFRAKLAA